MTEPKDKKTQEEGLVSLPRARESLRPANVVVGVKDRTMEIEPDEQGNFSFRTWLRTGPGEKTHHHIVGNINSYKETKPSIFRK